LFTRVKSNVLLRSDTSLHDFTMFAPIFANITSSSFAVQWGGTANSSCLIIGPTSNL